MAANIAKHMVKRSVKRAAVITSPFMPRPQGSRILTYHSIGGYNHEMTVGTSAFMAQMEWLADNCELITLDAAADGKPGIALTFDDGYRDNLTEAAPVLLRHGVPATVFMVAGRAGETLEEDRHDGLLMTWDELRAIKDMGIEVGAHTMNHVRLTDLSDDAQRPEIIDSVNRISDEISAPVIAFAYPYGTAFDYNDASKRLVAEAGCTIGVSNRYGVNRSSADPFALRRIWIDATDSLASFQAKVLGRLDILTAIDTRPGLHARRLLNRLTR